MREAGDAGARCGWWVVAVIGRVGVVLAMDNRKDVVAVCR